MRKWRKTIAAAMLSLVVALPGTARAASSDDENEVTHDARTEGYQPKVQVEKSSTALMWLLFAFLSAITLGVMFKDAKRTHLD